MARYRRAPAATRSSRPRRPRTRKDSTYGLVHDLRNSLAALALRVDVLMNDRACLAAQPDTIEAIGRIVGQLARGLAVVQRRFPAPPAPP
jgi:signal transduction histidine kinase